MNRKSILQTLLEFCDNDTQKLNQFLLEKINPVFQYRIEKQKSRTLESIKESFNKRYVDDEIRKTRNYYQLVSLLHFTFDVPLKFFDLPTEDVFYQKIKNVKDHHVELHRLKKLGDSSLRKTKSAKKYFEKSKLFLSQIKENLYIYDYLDRFDNEKSFKKNAYVEKHGKIFKEIETLLGDKNSFYPNIKYARFLAFPLGMFNYDENRKNNSPSKSVAVEKAIELSSTNLFKHIVRCLNNYPAFEKEEQRVDNILNYNGGFYLLIYPSKTYSYAYGDEGSYCLTEHYRFSKSAKTKPDMLLLEGDKYIRSPLSKIYEKEFKQFFRLCEKLCITDILPIMKQYQNIIRAFPIDKKEAEIGQMNNSLNSANLLPTKRDNIERSIQILKSEVKKFYIKKDKLDFFYKYHSI